MSKVAEHGHNISLGNCDLRAFAGLERVHLGSNIYIGPGACFLSTEADIYIGDYCMFGPEVMIITGDHRTDVIGEYMFEVTEKLPENDQPVYIERDVWVGARAIILKGTRIGEGSVIAAGAVVLGNIPPYSVYISKHKIIPRFSDEKLSEHLRIMREKSCMSCN